MATMENITASGVDSRLRGTVLGFGVLVAALVGLASVQAPLWAMSLLFVPAFFVSMMAYQSLFKTCMFMAAKGERDLGDGAEACACKYMSAELRSRARKILLFSVGTAGALTSLAVLAVAGR